MTAYAIRRHLKFHYLSASYQEYYAGKNWYMNAHLECMRLSELYNISIKKVVGVIAYLSSGCKWQDNLKQAEQMIAGNRGSYTTYAQNVKKAQGILVGKPFEPTRGIKIHNFYHAILMPNNMETVVVDSHMINAGYGKVTDSKTRKSVFSCKARYEIFQNAIRAIAKETNEVPNNIQATIWLVWKNKIGG